MWKSIRYGLYGALMATGVQLGCLILVLSWSTVAEAVMKLIGSL